MDLFDKILALVILFLFLFLPLLSRFSKPKPQKKEPTQAPPAQKIVKKKIKTKPQIYTPLPSSAMETTPDEVKKIPSLHHENPLLAKTRNLHPMQATVVYKEVLERYADKI